MYFIVDVEIFVEFIVVDNNFSDCMNELLESMGIKIVLCELFGLWFVRSVGLDVVYNNLEYVWLVDVDIRILFFSRKNVLFVCCNLLKVLFEYM